MADFLTTKQAAEILEIEPFSVSKAINRGKLHAVKFGTQWMIERDEVDRYKKETAKVGQSDKT
jgi:excisionase family DNA binding protein